MVSVLRRKRIKAVGLGLMSYHWAKLRFSSGCGKLWAVKGLPKRSK